MLLTALLGAAGCAQSRLSHEPGLISSWDRAPLASSAPATDAGTPAGGRGGSPAGEAGGAPAIAVELYTRHLSFGEPGESPVSKWWTKQKLHEQLKDVRAEFPFLANARWEEAEGEAAAPPYRLLIEATHAIDGNKTLHWFSSTSRYLIPSVDTGAIELDAKVIRRDDETVLNDYSALGLYRIKRHVLFLAFPWWWGYRVPSRTMEDTFRDLFLQIQRDAATLFGAGAAGE